jgi:glycosyltransferase involved in cell wall biosynthesis
MVVENPDDGRMMTSFGIPAEKIVLISGTAFDVEKTAPLPEPQTPITIAFVGRLLKDKGVHTLVEAHRRLAGRGRRYRLWLVGETDPSNRSSIPESELAGWSKLPYLEVLGYRSDIAAVWAQAHIAVLPSRREGLPQSLLEAAAFGRPIVATDAPGCREVARPGLNAITVPVDDIEALATALDILAQDPDMRRRFGAAGRELVLSRFSGKGAIAAMLQLYGRVLEGRPAPLVL